LEKPKAPGGKDTVAGKVLGGRTSNRKPTGVEKVKEVLEIHCWEKKKPTYLTENRRKAGRKKGDKLIERDTGLFPIGGFVISRTFSAIVLM